MIRSAAYFTWFYLCRQKHSFIRYIKYFLKCVKVPSTKCWSSLHRVTSGRDAGAGYWTLDTGPAQTFLKIEKPSPVSAVMCHMAPRCCPIINKIIIAVQQQRPPPRTRPAAVIRGCIGPAHSVTLLQIITSEHWHAGQDPEQGRGGASDRYLCRYLHNCVDI